MFLDNKELLQEFCKYFNSHLLAPDFVLKFKELLDNKPITDERIILPTKNLTVYKFLLHSNYPKLLNEIILNLKIEDSCKDIFLSEFSVEDFEAYKKRLELEKMKNEIKISSNNLYLCIDSSNFFIDLVITPFSQLHAEVVSTSEYFLEVLDAVGGNTQNLFLNATASNAFSQYIQMFVAFNLDISLNGIN